MDKLTIRQANIFDIDIIINISTICVKETAYYTNPIVNMRLYIEKFYNYQMIEKELTDEYSHFYLVNYKNNYVGYFKLNEYNSRSLFLKDLDNYFQIQWLILYSEFKNIGIEKEMIKKSIEIAKGLKYKNIIIDFNEKDKTNIDIVKKENFKNFLTFNFKIGDEKRTNIIFLKAI